MANPSQQSSTNKTSLHPAAYFLVASGGGIVGHDYASWLEVNRVVGALIGAAVSAIILQIAYVAYKDPEGKIKEGMTKLGAIVGAIMGFFIGIEMDGDFAWLIMTVICSGLGAGAGQMAAAIISFAGLAVLFLSQGPVGFALRAWITGQN